MKKTANLLMLVLLSGALFAQQSGSVIDTENAATFPIERLKAPTYADQYCAGFLSQNLLPNASYVAGGLHSPNATKFVLGDVVYLAGSGFQVGQQFTVVRELRNPTDYEIFKGQKAMLKASGHAYAELGRIRVLDTRSQEAVAQVEYSCEPMVPGDSLTPFSEKPVVTLREPARLDRFMPPNGKTTGRLLMARDFDTFLSTGSKVYLNVGSNQGVKVGDYFHAVRPYKVDREDEADSISLKATLAEDTQRRPAAMEPEMFVPHGGGPAIHISDYPRRAVGEMVVLSVTPTSSTAMIIFALEDVHLGDYAELQ